MIVDKIDVVNNDRNSSFMEKENEAYVPNIIGNQEQYGAMSLNRSVSRVFSISEKRGGPLQAFGEEPEKKKSVSFKFLSKLVMSKEQLYQLLRYKGQYHVPAKAFCTMEFMGQVLKGKKKLFTMDQIRPVSVPFQRKITIQAIAEKIGDREDIMVFLPDNYKQNINRDFLFNVVNTAVPTFFPRVVAELERVASLERKDKDEKVDIDPQMYELL